MSLRACRVCGVDLGIRYGRPAATCATPGCRRAYNRRRGQVDYLRRCAREWLDSADRFGDPSGTRRARAEQLTDQAERLAASPYTAKERPHA